MKVSIIIPIYNSENTLYRCLNSVLNQTLKEFECYLINDGSTDKSGEICDEFSKKDPRFKVVHQENMGVSKSKNKIIHICKGEYIGMIDSDDYIEPDFYELLYNKAKEFDVDLIKYSYICCYDNSSKTSKINKIISKEELYDKVIMPYDQILLNHTPLISLVNGIYKRNLFNDIKFNECIPKAYCEDVSVMFKLIENSSKLYILNDCKYVYYQNINTHSNNTKEMMKYIIVEFDNLIETSKNKNLLINVILDHLYGHYISALKKNINTDVYEKEIKKIINKCSLYSIKYCTQNTLHKIIQLLNL